MPRSDLLLAGWSGEPSAMKILLASSLYGISGGGAGLVVEHLARHLCEAGDQVVVLTLPYDRAPQEQSNDHEIPVRTVNLANFYPLFRKDEKPLWLRSMWQVVDTWNPHAFLTLRRVIGQEDPDVVHVHKMRGLSAAVWSAAAGLEGAALVQTCHDYESISPVGTLTGTVGRWANDGAWPVRPYQLIRGRISNPVDCVTAPSEYTLGTIRRRGLFHNARTRIVRNTHGISKVHLAGIRQSVERRSGSGPLRLLYLGRLEPEKGVEFVAEVVDSMKGGQVELDVAGWGSLTAELQNRYSEHTGIELLGPVTGERKRRLLDRCDALVVPSSCPEVFGIVIIEAFAHGKPVIASSVGGIPEIIQDGRTGFLLPPEDRRAWSALIRSLEADRSVLKAMESSCFDEAARYSPERIGHEYRSIYREILRESDRNAE